MNKMIKVVKIPNGEAPEKVREAWVGLTLPLAFKDNINGCKNEIGLVSQDFLPERDIAAVSEVEAMFILKKHDPEAAEWFKQQGIPRKERFLTFGIDEVKVL